MVAGSSRRISTRNPSFVSNRVRHFASGRQTPVNLHAEERSRGLAPKLGRVLKEKASEDFSRLFKGASKTRQQMGEMKDIVAHWRLDDAQGQLEELEDLLISVDFGPETAKKIVDRVRERVASNEISDGSELRAELRRSIASLIRERGGDSELNMDENEAPSVMMLVGVNGSGKTTTIGKLASKLTGDGEGAQKGEKVLLAAGDTYRAAAADQLAVWAERTDSELIRGREERGGEKPSEVLRRGVLEAKERRAKVCILDTAGRLQNDGELMEEIGRCRRSVEVALGRKANEILLCLDGTSGLNIVSQARGFKEACDVSGIVITKLDSTSKGGAAISAVDELGVPIKLIGVGEGVDDLQAFNASEFADGLLPEEL